MTKYIVTYKQIMDGVEFGLRQNVQNEEVLKIILKPIAIEIETILEDDCEEAE